MRIDPEQIDAMKRGGRPTLEELSQHLVFRPLDASVQLAGARMMLQRASVAVELRDTLVERHGAHEAMVTLMRIGYRAGIADARFIREAWPNINVGDAFTAGTRLHMLTGTVKVETIGNDFDFDRGRYASEFLWLNSVEATEYHRAHGRSTEPVCWMQLGYASGYASDFFRRLVVYKEKHCAAMGHRHCHLQGGTADRWGEDDPLVRLFREEIIASATPGRGRGVAADPGRSAGPDPTEADDLAAILLAPVAERIALIAAAGLPALFIGPPGSGRRRAAQACFETMTQRASLRRFHARSAALAELLEGLASKSRKSNRPAFVQIDEIECLSAEHQSMLADHLTAPGSGGPLVLATTACPSPGEALRPDLFHAFAAVRLPAFSIRGDIIRIADAVLQQLGREIGRPSARLTAGSQKVLSGMRLDGNLPELRAVLRDALLDCTGDDISVARVPEPVPAGTAAAERLFDALSQGRIEVDKLSSQLCRKALDLSGGNVAAAARLVGLTRAQLDYRLRNLRE